MQYDFEWDPKKAKINIRKHNITFERAGTIFRDPQAISIVDQEHSENEDRWITIGFDSSGVLLVVIHTFNYVSQEVCKIRIISARKATKSEMKFY
jgi:uncharacterized DUF497 family protein